MKQIKQQQRKGTWDTQREEPFELFVSATHVRWTFYKDTHKVLGQTFGVCVL